MEAKRILGRPVVTRERSVVGEIEHMGISVEEAVVTAKTVIGAVGLKRLKAQEEISKYKFR